MMMMMSGSPAVSLMALVCLGWSCCAHDAVRNPRQILSSGDANPRSSLRVGASFTGLTPAPTVLPADHAQTTITIIIEPPPSHPGGTPSQEDAALPELRKPRTARLLTQRRLNSVSDKAQDAGLITTSDNSQGESDYPLVVIWALPIPIPITNPIPIPSKGQQHKHLNLDVLLSYRFSLLCPRFCPFW